MVEINSVHAAISLVDGLLVQERGIRSTSPNHADLVKLIEVELAHLPDLKNALSHLRRLLSQKNRVSYEMRHFTRSDAEALLQHLQRLADWVNRHRPSEASA